MGVDRAKDRSGNVYRLPLYDIVNDGLDAWTKRKDNTTKLEDWTKRTKPNSRENKALNVINKNKLPDIIDENLNKTTLGVFDEP